MRLRYWFWFESMDYSLNSESVLCLCRFWKIQRIILTRTIIKLTKCLLYNFSLKEILPIQIFLVSYTNYCTSNAQIDKRLLVFRICKVTCPCKTLAARQHRLINTLAERTICKRQFLKKMSTLLRNITIFLQSLPWTQLNLQFIVYTNCICNL